MGAVGGRKECSRQGGRVQKPPQQGYVALGAPKDRQRTASEDQGGMEGQETGGWAGPPSTTLEATSGNLVFALRIVGGFQANGTTNPICIWTSTCLLLCGMDTAEKARLGTEHYLKG